MNMNIYKPSQKYI